MLARALHKSPLNTYNKLPVLLLFVRWRPSTRLPGRNVTVVFIVFAILVVVLLSFRRQQAM